MGIHLSGNAGKIPGCSFCYRSPCVLLILVLAFLVIPAAAPAVPGSPATMQDTTVSRAGTVILDGDRGPDAASPVPSISVRPTIVPARQNRSSLIQTTKNITDRPRIIVPTWLFLLILATACAGLIVIVHLLLRRSGVLPARPAKPGDIVPGTATIVDTSATQPPGLADKSAPAVPFPLSLRKRFLHPEFIGEGGLARVFRAQDIRTGATVAVKVPVQYDEITGTHFTRDISLWQGLEHENIIRILSSNILPVPYIEMEYAPTSLAALPLPLPEEKAVAIVLGAARGIAYAHGKGIVHRDIKPENILLSEHGIPKVTDWGLGKAISDTRQSSIIGFSPAYAAPEQLAPHRFGRPGPATDIYQLGMLLCELLTGTPAFMADGLHTLNAAILEKTPVIGSWHGRQEMLLKKIILRCIEKKPSDRYGSVAGMIHDLEEVQLASGWTVSL